MLKVNPNYEKLPGSYLFAEIARRVKEYTQANPGADVIRLGIGDVTRPLAPAVVEAFEKAAREMGCAETFHGYGPDYGYDFLVNAIIENDYRALGVEVAFDEVFVSDGAKCDVSNVQELFSDDAVIAVTDPVYPVYVDSNAMAGRAGTYAGDRWDRLVYLPCNAENGFVPPLPDRPVDVIYLCYPNNPTGTTLTREQLKVFVDYARESSSTTRRTRRSSPPTPRAASMRSRAPETWPSSVAAIPRPPGSPARAAAGWSFPTACMAWGPAVSPWSSTRCGSVAWAASSTA